MAAHFALIIRQNVHECCALWSSSALYDAALAYTIRWSLFNTLARQTVWRLAAPAAEHERGILVATTGRLATAAQRDEMETIDCSSAETKRKANSLNVLYSIISSLNLHFVFVSYEVSKYSRRMCVCAVERNGENERVCLSYSCTVNFLRSSSSSATDHSIISTIVFCLFAERNGESQMVCATLR